MKISARIILLLTRQKDPSKKSRASAGHAFSFFLFTFSIYFFLFSVPSYSQDLDEVQQKLIQQKIKESGLTEAELKKKAEAAGYTVEDFIKLQQAATTKEAATQSTQTQEKVIVTPPTEPKSGNWLVPEFQGREGAEGLQAFGYNIFNYKAFTFEPSLNVPVPTNYVVGPGDEIVISLWGETQLVENLTVSKNGDIYIPNVGLISINGLTLKELKTKLFSVLSQVYASLKSDQVEARTKLDVSTGKLRSVKVYVLGEVNTPGGYTLSAMSSSFTALYYCGGPTLNGTLRNVQIMRGGKNIASIDLYEYLITGNKSKDVRLEDEDIIYVPPVGKRIAVGGNAFRPAIYELKNEEKLTDLLKYSGGLKFTAYFDRVHIERVIPFAERKMYANNILSLDIRFNSIDELLKSSYILENGDVVTIPGINTLPENRVSISGFVKKPGVYELPKNGMKIRDLIIKADSLQKEAFLDRGLLIRTLPSEKKEIYNFNVMLALKGDTENNFTLMNRDEIRIFDQQSFYPAQTVEIAGEVKNPGVFTRFANMSLTELITLSGGLTVKATTKNIEITRMDTTNVDIFSQKFTVDLPTEFWKINPDNDFMLKDFDRVLIKSDPFKEFNQNVSISGEVTYPGIYTILHQGEKLSNFIKRAGGLKPTANTKGIFIERDQKLLERSAIKIADSLIFRSKSVTLYNPNLISEFSKRIPLEWEEIVNDTNSVYNIILKPGDIVVAPKDPQIVTVVGDVGIPSSVPFKDGKKLSYYVRQAGGYRETSAKGDEVVILPNGKKWEPSGFFLFPDSPIESGSTIIVPTLIEYSNSNTWSYIRDIFAVLSSTAIVILTVINLTK